MATTARPSARTPLHHWHAARGARFADRDGWQVPVSYSAALERLDSARGGRLVLADVSPFAKISLLGRNVPALTHSLLGEGPASHPLGVATFSAGGTALACRLTEDHLLLLASTTDPGPLEQSLEPHLHEFPAVRADVTTAHAGICLAGNQVEELLRRVTSLPLTTRLTPGCCAETGLAGVHALLVRTPRGSPPFLLVYVAWDQAEYVWDRLLDAGRAWDIATLGVDSLTALGFG